MRKYLFAFALLCLSLVFCPHASAQDLSQTANLTATSPNCATLNSCLVVTLNSPTTQDIGSASIDISGTFSGTVTFEAFGGNTWQALNATPSNSATPASTATAPGLWQANVAAYQQIRIRCSAFTSGTIVAVINLSRASR